MQNLEHAENMLTMSNKDFNALCGMMVNTDYFSNEIFGFHAQQAVEKAAKALLDIFSIEYKKIHDIGELFNLLRQNGNVIPVDFLDLQDLTEYAVDLRYDSFELDADSLDRKMILEKVSGFIDYVKRLLDQHKL
ncbi:MAG: HEPN domain-containing protein [Ignavibacteriaceae bacterium]|nr:HEPN domain-containing protein [Ignavibacteriaceae bacterium]